MGNVSHNQASEPGVDDLCVNSKTLLRFITCGSVDDGKSTLIGRLLYESRAIFADHFAELKEDSQRAGSQSGEIDFALLVDGLTAEREQGITIDIAHRFFSTATRKFIIADTPGHEQFTRNMATAASTADLAVILIDARAGVLTQTRRHSHIIRLMNVNQVILAVNKMDLVNFDQARYEEIIADYRSFAAQIGLTAVTTIPLSALRGDNLTARSARTPWYRGRTLLEQLEVVAPNAGAAEDRAFVMPVQWINRPGSDFRGFAGLVAAGRVRPGDAIKVLPSGHISTVSRIVTVDGDLDEAQAGQSITLTLANHLDVSRGALIAQADNPPPVADRFDAMIIWMAEAALLQGRRYWLKLGTETVGATVPRIRHALEVNTQNEISVETLGLNDIGVAEVYLDRLIACAPFDQEPALGRFILVDLASNDTVAAGMIIGALRRSLDVKWQTLDVGREAHAAQKGQTPRILWFTGLSGSGKSTIANMVEKKLHAMGRHSFLLDGDNLRHGLNKDLGFSDADRVENVRRVAEMARLMADAGLIVLTALISPFRAEREMARALMPDGEFVEVFIDTPLDVAETRDVKGLYAKARAGEIQNFTGIDSPYERPEQPDIRVDTLNESPENAADRIVAKLFGG